MGDDFRRLSKNQLIRQIIRLTERLDALEKRNAELEIELARLRKNSSNSSKPPSSDIVKPQEVIETSESSKTRKIGGQPGHPKHERAVFAPEQVDAVIEHRLECCPYCRGKLLKARQKEPRVVQQIELVDKPTRVEEHRAEAYWCPHCREFHYAPLPREVQEGGLLGTNLTALVGYLKGVCHASYSTIHTFFRDVLKLEIAKGQLVKVVGKVSAALEDPYEELLGRLRLESVINIDETGHKVNGDPHWTWCFRAKLFTLFKVDCSRGSEVLIEVLGKEFDGVIGADYFSAYRKYMREFDVLVQFCLAHLIRDVKFLITLPDPETRRYGQRLLGRLKDLFGVIHRRDTMGERRFEREIEQARRRLIETATHAPFTAEAHNMANRFRKHGEAYFRFITTPGIEPTNNIAEQAIRFVVIDRRITQGTRGDAGNRWSERIWTMVATCAQRGMSLFEFLQKAVHAHFTYQSAPSLLPNTS